MTKSMKCVLFSFHINLAVVRVRSLGFKFQANLKNAGPE